MSKELMYVLISKMHVKLNKIIERNNYNLLNDDVQQYSQRLDRVLARYSKTLGFTRKYSCRHCPYKYKKNGCISR